MASVTSLVVALFVIQGVQPLFFEDLQKIDFNKILSSLESKQITYNQVLDNVIDLVNMETIKNGNSEMELPDINEDFTRTFLGVTVNGNFEADQGTLADLSTLRRMGDMDLEKTEDGYTVAVVVGLATLRLRYEHYRVKLSWDPSVAGHLNSQVGTSSIQASATISFSCTNCTAWLNGVRVLALEGLEVSVGGSWFGPLNWLFSWFANKLANDNREKIIARVEEGLSNLATNSLEKIRCDANH